jgi:valyl-tRNA synthetase
MIMVQRLDEIPKAYEPKQVEEKWHRFWLEQGYFTPQIDHSRKPFVLIMPPPNITGELHLGHALTATLEDALARYHRMRGEPTLWLPGVDHAGIAGQNAVEQHLAQKGLSRHELEREGFLDEMWRWTEKYRSIIAHQHQRLGASCDWSRERFTLDREPSYAVRTTFHRLYHKGLIYRGERIINWCPRCATALSDLEVEHTEIHGHLYYIRYPLEGGGTITVATTRPETLLGDTAVAVNPNDERYRSLWGRRASLPMVGRAIPIITADSVDPSFGSGVVKITPSHDPADFEIAQRQNLPRVCVMNQDATMNENAGRYAGLDRFACRQALLTDLEAAGLLHKVEPYSYAVGHCQRCHTIVEPLVSKQWFVRMAPLAEKAKQAVWDGRIEIIPQHFTKVYLEWLENIRDWCISRQLWWGQRIPVWYCSDCTMLTVAVSDPQSCAHCGSSAIAQDPDVLDTWFSSALWPHSTLGWPEETEELRYFYPTSVLETGYDILFFWVARMVIMGLENTGEVPFRKVYLHGLIRDERGEKMSKTRGNVVNPLELVDKYGADALRFALVAGSSPGNDVRVSPQKLEGSRNFANKLWNAARFVIGNIESEVKAPQHPLPGEDRWILSRLNRLILSVNRLIDEFMLGEALSQIHDFLWGEYCDWYIELAKIRLRQGDASPIPVLVYVLESSLRLLHPFMPFITEELWQSLARYQPQGVDSLMLAPYPVCDEEAIDPVAEAEMKTVIEVIKSIRNARSEHHVAPAKWIEAIVVAHELKSAFEAQSEAIKTLARVQPLTILSSLEESPMPSQEMGMITGLVGVEVMLPLRALFDPEAERKRLEREIGSCEAEIARLSIRLREQEFLSKAPSEVVAREQRKLKELEHKLEKLSEHLAELSKKEA